MTAYGRWIFETDCHQSFFSLEFVIDKVFNR